MEIQALDDYKLLKACSDGKTEAFEVIVRKYRSFICALTYSAVGDLEKSEELAQEIFIIAWNNLSQLKDLSKFKNWLYCITKNHIRYFFRIKKKDILSAVAPIAKSEPPATSQDDPVKRLISKETQQYIWNALSHIPPHYREPLVLFYWEGKSVRQVAQFFDLTEVTAKQRLSRARTMVRANIGTYLEDTVAASSPARKFSAGVIALIAAGTVIKTGTTSATAAASTSAGAKAGSWLSSWLGTTSAKITLTVSVTILILITGMFIIQNRNQPEPAKPLHTLPPDLDNGMVMHLSFDDIERENNIIKIIDKSLTGNDGVLLGGELVKGKIGVALKCNAQNKSDGVRVKDHPTLDLDAVTIAAWIKIGQIDGQWNRILDKGWRTAYNLCIGGEYGGRTWYQDRVEMECAGNAVTSKKPVVDNEWHFVAGTYDGQTTKLYIDGELDNEKEHKKSSMKHNDVDVMIGILAVPEEPPHNHAFFDGLIDEVRLYNRVLSGEEISKLYRYNPGY